MKRLENKIAMITGAAGGMGATEAALFAAEGAKVFITDVQEEKLSIVAESIRAQGGIVEYAVQDVSVEESWIEAVRKVEQVFGGIDILVNNAGTTGNLLGPIEERTVLEFNRVIGVNLLSQFLGVKTVVPYMRKNKAGSIINISSIGGIIGSANATLTPLQRGDHGALQKGLRQNSLKTTSG